MNYDNELDRLRGRPWAQTVSGRATPLTEITPSDIYWPDIAYALSYLNRYAGHAGFYSVAQHTCHPLELIPEKARPYWLLHDAHEYLVGDIMRPVWRALGDDLRAAIFSLKYDLDFAIYTAAGLEWPLPEDVQDVIRETDERMLKTEERDLFVKHVLPWPGDAEPFAARIEWRWSPEMAYYRFRSALKKYAGVIVPPLYEIENAVDRFTP